MPKFISRMRRSNTSNSQKGTVSALLNRDRLEIWQAKYLEATGKQPTNTELLIELDRAVEEYNQTTKARVVACLSN